MEFVTLVDRKGNAIGEAEKLAAHQNSGRLHLAFSSFVFNANDELLLQKRASSKYHFAGLWSNTCCGHPRPGEETRRAAGRRLLEEFGFYTELHRCFSLTYEAHDKTSGLTEKEFLHVFAGRFDKVDCPDPMEIAAWRWLSLPDIRTAFERAPDMFTPWFGLLLDRTPAVLASTPRHL